MPRPLPRAAAALLAAAAVLALASCGSSGGHHDDSAAKASATPPVRPSAYDNPSPGPAPTATAHLDDPAAVADAYIRASQTVTAADAAAPPRRAEVYMAPANPERGMGQPVWDVPPAGVTRKPIKVQATRTATEAGKTVIRVVYTLADVKADKTSNTQAPVTTYVVCQQQPDGTWLVLRESPDLSP